ncbi:SAM-dependent methyltransferase [Lacimicrobium alkaliphilum]|uniref:Cyclopropane-fatty-acyl-phospholipid synthase n=1 Tax=Lacimicrobium alkaliphilum TaxID=1526571 RepID=A0A0U3B6D4_9ALTE|nr:cyclopropane-fatty-acyl-phospholipid synthase family protein [Lacimicrobium alkaliphilum]ALS99161.1 cyclopropane-fatty-acyl-phospholipid synthase [Lacimicrobium alkaliphilum]
MQSGEQVLNQSGPLNWWNRLARASLLNLLSQLPEGYLVLKEDGVLIEHFGNPDSDIKAEIDVLHPDFYPRILLGGSVASGETFVDGLWRTPDITSVIRLFVRNMPLLDELEARLGWLLKPVNLIKKMRRKNSRNGAKKNIAAHYDLGNELYRRFLDDSMMYSAAIYPKHQATLPEAQQYKLRHICEKLSLGPEDHLLEIGTGWGGLALFAAQEYGCKVTTTTISEEQFSYARSQIESAGLQDCITLLNKDYRDLQGQYDKLVSIEMIEAVGQEYLPVFFKKCNDLLKPGGLMLLQAITISEPRFETYSKSQDFIQQHIFPGGFLPSLHLLSEHIAKRTDMVIRDCHDIGLHYAQTLNDWHQRFLSRSDELLPLGYDERFMRLWRFYFCYCEGGFLERTISAVQLLTSRQGYRDAVNRL